MRASSTPLEIATTALEGDERALGRLISLIESEPSTVSEITALLSGRPRSAQIIGITGSAGVGKSTLIADLVRQFREQRRRVAIVAIDPSSPFTGGALLGDRIRMQAHILDPNVFIRSMSARGHLGGLASATPDVVDLLSRVGFDLVIIETVGIGQSEVEIATYADTVVVIATADSGDAVQVAKAGVLEIGDVLVVNKSDRPGSSGVAGDLREMLMLGERGQEFHPQVIEVSAQMQIGIAELVDELDRHRQWLSMSGELERRRLHRAEQRLRAVIAELAVTNVVQYHAGDAFQTAAAVLSTGARDVHSLASQLLEKSARSSSTTT